MVYNCVWHSFIIPWEMWLWFHWRKFQTAFGYWYQGDFQQALSQNECLGIVLMVCQHWFRSVDHDLWQCMTSLDLNVFIVDMLFYPMLRADSRFWLVNNREIWSRISRLTSSAWDIKTKERHWWRHNGDSDRWPLSLPLRYDLVTLCLYDDLG